MTEKMFKLSLVICKNVMFLVLFKDISVHPTYSKPVNVLNMKAETILCGFVYLQSIIFNIFFALPHSVHSQYIAQMSQHLHRLTASHM